MYILLSPAKTLSEQTLIKYPSTTKPKFLKYAQLISNELKRLSPSQLMQLQAISLDLAQTNFERNQQWKRTDHKAGIISGLELFKGDVYQGLAIEDWEQADWEFGTRHLGILSGLYGLLRPTDGILPYRLEMGSRIKIEDNSNLYSIWKPLVTKALNQLEQPFILNLASAEYFKAVDQKALKKPIVQVEFKDCKGGKYKVISFWAKRARGALAKWLVQNRITNKNEIEAFTELGYYFESKVSSENTIVFHRNPQ